MKGRTSMSLVSRLDDKIIRIELVDKNSGCLVTIIDLTPENFGLMMGGLSQIECDFNVYNNYDILGKKKETKEEIIDISSIEKTYIDDTFKNNMLQLVSPYLTDGWMVEEYDIKVYNYHKALNNNQYKVGFYRYVLA